MFTIFSNKTDQDVLDREKTEPIIREIVSKIREIANKYEPDRHDYGEYTPTDAYKIESLGYKINWPKKSLELEVVYNQPAKLHTPWGSIFLLRNPYMKNGFKILHELYMYFGLEFQIVEKCSGGTQPEPFKFYKLTKESNGEISQIEIQAVDRKTGDLVVCYYNCDHTFFKITRLSQTPIASPSTQAHAPSPSAPS